MPNTTNIFTARISSKSIHMLPYLIWVLLANINHFLVIPFNNNKVKNTNFQAKHDNDEWNQDLELEDKSIEKKNHYEPPNKYLWLHDFPGPNPIDQALAQGATHNKYL